MSVTLHASSERFQIWHGDCLAVLKTLPSNSVDSIVTDPPSGIAFMGKEWDKDKGGRDAWIAWLAEIMVEAMRVLKPGGHALVWALPRTSHWTATAVENAGFEIRDIVHHLFGSGFPKNLDVSKAIDEHLAGPCSMCEGRRKMWKQGKILHRDKPAVETLFEAEGVEHVRCPNCRGKGKEPARKTKRIPYTGDALMRHDGENTRPWMEEALARGYTEVADDTPATPEAAAWEGWGTALKPAAEHWILGRKPLAEKSVAANVLAHGVGALNIGGSRVGDEVLPAQVAGEAKVGTFERESMVTPERVGRWPAHLVLSHAPQCDDHACVWWCPVREIDGQSGISKSRAGKPRQGKNGDGWGMTATGTEHDDEGGASRFFKTLDRDEMTPNAHEGTRLQNSEVKHQFSYGDEGGPSRYFQTFDPLDETLFAYVPKPSAREKNEGLDDQPDRVLNRVNPGGLENDPRWAPVETKNSHPTCKSVKLMTYLINLITPPGGVVLDCFFGSGTTGVAALLGGFKIVGIEMDPTYIEIATGRVEHADKKATEIKTLGEQNKAGDQAGGNA